MTKNQFDKIASNLHGVPVDALQRASLRYAAKRLRASGESGSANAAMLLEQMADEHGMEEYESLTVVQDVNS